MVVKVKGRQTNRFGQEPKKDKAIEDKTLNKMRRGKDELTNSGQYYKQFTLVNYDSRVVKWGNFKSGKL